MSTLKRNFYLHLESKCKVIYTQKNIDSFNKMEKKKFYNFLRRGQSQSSFYYAFWKNNDVFDMLSKVLCFISAANLDWKVF